MNDAREEYEVLLSAYLDGELDEVETARVEDLIASSPAVRREYQALQRLVVGTNDVFANRDEPPEAVWDDFLDNVYNRLERKTGWVIFIIGATLLTLYGAYAFVTQPFASAMLKMIIVLPLAGLAVVFWSVLRNRLHTIKTDRYTREVHR
jgi:hypothetical protein